jgi:hypothetical protein
MSENGAESLKMVKQTSTMKTGLVLCAVTGNTGELAHIGSHDLAILY